MPDPGHNGRVPTSSAPLPALLPVLALVCNAFIWGTSWWPFRHLEAAGLHPLWTTVALHSVSLAVLLLWRPRALWHVCRTPALWTLVAAAGVTNAAFNWGVVAGDVVRVVLLFYLMPLWAVLFARVLLGEALTASAAGRVLLALAGAAIVLWPADGKGLPWPVSLADWLGVVGGIAFALNNVMLRRHADEPGEARAVAMFAGGIAVAGVLACALASQGSAAWPPPPAPGWLALAGGMGLLFLGSNMALQFGASRLPSNVTSVVMLTEVLFASVSAAWLGGARLTPQLLGGGACIVAAALLAALHRPARH